MLTGPEPATKMPVAAEIVPVLVTPPEKTDTDPAAVPISMPISADGNRAAGLLMPPEKVETSSTSMPREVADNGAAVADAAGEGRDKTPNAAGHANSRARRVDDGAAVGDAAEKAGHAWTDEDTGAAVDERPLLLMPPRSVE